MTKTIKKVTQAAALPEAWDLNTDIYFQKREFLTHAEKYNPCDQRYYQLYIDDKFSAGTIVYTLRINFFTYFFNLPSPIKMNIIGPPVSISCSGLIGDQEGIDFLIEEIFKKEKGLVLCLNSTPSHCIAPAVLMSTLPTILMEHDFNSWDDYKQSLRSSYRRRLKKIESLFEGIKIEESDCRRYNETMHNYYLQVLKKTDTKLEVLTKDFFKYLPDKFRLVTYSHKDTVVGWHINLKDNDTFYYFFGGINYEYNKTFNIYFNNLNSIVQESLKLNCKKLDFGQTAEIPKTRMGGHVVEKGMFVYHRYAILRKLLSYGKNLLSYDRGIPDVAVFKKKS